MGREPADLVIKGARYLNVIDGAMVAGDIAVAGDTIVGVQADYHGVREMDGRGKVVVPGFIDTHVHVESTYISPWEFDRVVLALCTDDRNPLDIAEEGHLDHLIRSAIGASAPMGAVYRAVSW